MTMLLYIVTTWKYWSMDNTKNRKRKGKLLPKNEEISGWKVHTNTQKLNIYFNDHRCLSRSEESKCMWTHGKDGVTLSCVCMCLSSSIFGKSFPILCYDHCKMNYVPSSFLHHKSHFKERNSYVSILTKFLKAQRKGETHQTAWEPL